MNFKKSEVIFMWQLWLIISGFFFILEIFTFGFLVFWFGIGALFAMLVSFFVDNIIAQTTVFLITSTLLLFATRAFADKFAKTDDKNKTNAYALEGKIGKVIQTIDPVEGQGQIKIGGEIWSAKSLDDTCISQDTKVMVEKIDGVKAIVKPV